MSTMAKAPKIPTPEQLKKRRESAGYSIEACAEAIGVKRATWYAWETRSQNRRPSPSHAILIDLLFSGKLI